MSNETPSAEPLFCHASALILSVVSIFTIIGTVRTVVPVPAALTFVLEPMFTDELSVTPIILSPVAFESNVTVSIPRNVLVAGGTNRFE